MRALFSSTTVVLALVLSAAVAATSARADSDDSMFGGSEFNGSYQNKELGLSLQLKDGFGTATAARDHALTSAGIILKYRVINPSHFMGQVRCKDGEFYPVQGVLADDGSIVFQALQCSPIAVMQWTMASTTAKAPRQARTKLPGNKPSSSQFDDSTPCADVLAIAKHCDERDRSCKALEAYFVDILDFIDAMDGQSSDDEFIKEMAVSAITIVNDPKICRSGVTLEDIANYIYDNRLAIAIGGVLRR